MKSQHLVKSLFPHSATTSDVTVRVSVSFLPEQSEPGKGRWFWAYHVRVENGGRKSVQLISREWVIVDGRGGRHEVMGEGVVGEQPVIEPGASFDYDEALVLDPDQPEAYLNKGFALLHLPEAERRAKPMFDTALAKKTRRPELAYYGRAVAHELNGDVRAAYFDYREASRIDPKWRDPKTELARFKVN